MNPYWGQGQFRRGPEPWMHGGGADGWIGLVFMVLILAALVVGIVLIVRALRSRHHHTVAAVPVVAGSGVPLAAQPAPSAAALRVLEERYARGDIDRDEFFQRRNDLYVMGIPSPPVAQAQTPQATGA